MKKPPPRTKPAAPRSVDPPAQALAAAWYLAVALSALAFGFTIMRGSDLWWHIAGGRWMLEHQTLWVPDPFSFTSAGQRWINDAWLSDVLLALWVEQFGMESLAYWKWSLIVGTALLVYRLTTELAGDRLTAYLGTTLGLAIAGPFLDVRPQLYSFLGWVVLLAATVGRRRPPTWLPLLFLVWVNLHASFLLGLLSLPLVLLPSLRLPEERRRTALLGLLCVAACLCNPSGAVVLLRPLRYALDSSSPFLTLGEWLPPFRPGGIRSWLYPWGIAVYAAGALLLLLKDEARRRSTWVVLGVGALTLAMSLQSRRFVPFFGLAQSLTFALAWGPLLQSVSARIPSWAPPAGALLISILWLYPYPIQARAFHYLTADYEFPVETLNFAEVNQLSGNVFNYYNWGGYVHLRSRGRLKVFVDGRSETIYSDKTFNDYMKVLQQHPGWQAIVDRSGADFILWPSRNAAVVQGMLAAGGWKLLYMDHVSLLLRRESLVLPAELRATPVSSFQQLSLGVKALGDRDPLAARGFLTRALELQPDLEPACLNLVRAASLVGDAGAARVIADRCRRNYPDPQRERVLEALLARAAAVDSPVGRP